MKTIEINLYSFDELSEDAKAKALYDHTNFLNVIHGVDGDDLDYNYHQEDVIDNIQMNEYLFFSDGDLAHITHYVENHPKAGITEFHFHGETVSLT